MQAMATVYAPIQMAPTNLSQPILPGWSFSLFSIDLGESSDPALERAAVERVGSYGRQLGHLAEALEVVIERLQLLEADLSPEKKDALKVFLGDVAAIRQLKASAGAPATTASA